MSEVQPRISGEDVSTELQAIRYELAVLSFGLTDAARAEEGVKPWVDSPDAQGQLLGAWTTEHGTLGKLFVLRSFTDQEELDDERRRARLASNPFGAKDHLTDLTLNGYAPFPFMPPVKPGQFGPIYEIRDYHLRPGGLPTTIEGWRKALPNRDPISPVTIVMYALDGPARIVHIVPFPGLDERVAIRKELVEQGIWPPPGGPEQILEGQSIMAWPTAFSPLR